MKQHMGKVRRKMRLISRVHAARRGDSLKLCAAQLCNSFRISDRNGTEGMEFCVRRCKYDK